MVISRRVGSLSDSFLVKQASAGAVDLFATRRDPFYGSRSCICDFSSAVAFVHKGFKESIGQTSRCDRTDWVIESIL